MENFHAKTSNQQISMPKYLLEHICAGVNGRILHFLMCFELEQRDVACQRLIFDLVFFTTRVSDTSNTSTTQATQA